MSTGYVSGCAKMSRMVIRYAMHKLLTAIIVNDIRRSFDLMLPSIDTQIGELRKALGVRPNMLVAEATLCSVAKSLDIFVQAATHRETLLCRPTSPHVVEAIRQRNVELKRLHNELVICKLVTVQGDTRPRNLSVEN